MSWKGKRCLVTGGAGFIGSHLVDCLIQKGAKVTVLDDLSTGFQKNLANVENSNMHFVQDSLLNEGILENIIFGIEYVFHLAALPSVPQSIAEPIKTGKVNALGTLKLLEYSRKASVKKVVFSSSCAVYGDSLASPLSEEEIPMPMSPYAFQKLMSEDFCKMYNTIYDLPTTSLRYFNVYGPRQDLSSEYSAVVPKFISSVSNGISPIIYGDGGQSRDFVFVSDVVNANLKAAVEPYTDGLSINIGSGYSTTIKELAEYTIDFFNSNLSLNYKDHRKGDIRHSLANISQAKKLLHYEPQYDFKRGLSEAAGYFSSFKN